MLPLCKGNVLQRRVWPAREERSSVCRRYSRTQITGSRASRVERVKGAWRAGARTANVNVYRNGILLTRVVQWYRRRCYACVCVLHLKTPFLLVDIQHTQCSRVFFILEIYNMCGHKTTTQAATLYQANSGSAMPCHYAGLWQAHQTHTS